MGLLERRAWVMAAVAAAAYVAYVMIVALTGVHYRWVLLGTVGAAVVLGVVLDRVPRRERETDQRDREIDRFGDHVGNSLVVIGALTALLLALFEVSYFWIANVLYLAFTLSAVLGSMARLAAYREGFHPW